jgi:hypothetical protein
VSRIAGSASIIVAGLVILFVAFFLFAVFGLTTGGVEVIPGPPRVSDAQLRALTLGTSESEVERRFGEGDDALEYQDTGAAVEPLEGECVYYAQAGTGNIRDVVQLCFRDGKLTSKRKFAATPGVPLIS